MSHDGQATPRIGDQINLFIPWTTLAWTQVHHGQLPLWNPYSVLGMPLAFNWESAPFGLPALLGYLAPLRYAYTIGVLATLAIAGTGVYVLGRVLGLGVFGCVMAATVYELSGRFMVTLGWSLGSVMSWSGWLFALAILVVRGRHRRRDIALLAVVLAAMVYAGYPEGIILLGTALAVFLVVILISRATRLARVSQPILRPVGDLIVAAIAGVALSAPLLLPGLQVISRSSRNGKLGVGVQTVTSGYLLKAIVPSFDGVPWRMDFFHRTAGSTVIYVGVITVVMALVAVGVRWRQPEVLAFVAVAAVTAGVVFLRPLASLIDRLPNAGSVRFYDALGPLTLAFAVLAGVGIDMIARSRRKRAVYRWAAVGFGGIGLFLLALFLFGRGHLSPMEAATRRASFLWPAIETAVGLVVIGILMVIDRRNRQSPAPGNRFRFAGGWAATALVICGTVSLVASGTPAFKSSPTYVTTTPAVVALQRAVGSSLVGFGEVCLPADSPNVVSLGVTPNVNVIYQIQEFGVYDPTVPYSYLTAWQGSGKKSAGAKNHRASNIFCPSVTSVTKARLFGIGFVLEQHGAPGPRGAVLEKRVGNEDLYRIPGSSAATLTPLLPNGRRPPNDASGTPVSVTHPDPASWKVVTQKTTPQVLRLRLTDLPGWHATVDGQPLRLSTFDNVMLQAKIPPGHHTIVVQYWPDTFTVGIVAAGLAVLALFLMIVLGGRWKRRRLPIHRESADLL